MQLLETKKRIISARQIRLFWKAAVDITFIPPAMMAFTPTARMICSPVGNFTVWCLPCLGSIASGRPALLSWMVLIICIVLMSSLAILRIRVVIGRHCLSVRRIIPSVPLDRRSRFCIPFPLTPRLCRTRAVCICSILPIRLRVTGSALILWWIRCWIRIPRQDTRCRWWCPPGRGDLPSGSVQERPALAHH